MSNFDDAQNLPSGVYQAEFVTDIPTRSMGETILKFRLTEPSDKKHPQRGMGGRIARAWLLFDDPNPITKTKALEKRGELLQAVGAQTVVAARGRLLRIRVERIVMRSDPSRYKSAVVEFLPLVDKDVKKYVEPN